MSEASDAFNKFKDEVAARFHARTFLDDLSANSFDASFQFVLDEVGSSTFVRLIRPGAHELYPERMAHYLAENAVDPVRTLLKQVVLTHLLEISDSRQIKAAERARDRRALSPA